MKKYYNTTNEKGVELKKKYIQSKPSKHESNGVVPGGHG